MEKADSKIVRKKKEKYYKSKTIHEDLISFPSPSKIPLIQSFFRAKV